MQMNRTQIGILTIELHSLSRMFNVRLKKLTDATLCVNDQNSKINCFVVWFQ